MGSDFQLAKWPLAFLALAVIFVAGIYLVGTDVPDTDERSCPKDTGPRAATVLLLDTSDPLTAKHQEELKRLVDRIGSELVAGELLAVYELTQDQGAPNKIVDICRPFINPNESGWRDEIFRGRYHHIRDWNHFSEELTQLFAKTESGSQKTSPLLETIAVLAARHAQSKHGDQDFRVHFVIFSDLLQHTERLSHYKEDYPHAKTMRRYAPDLLTDLTGVRVSLLRLARPGKSQQWQTQDHYYWWTELIMEQGGTIEMQDSI